MKRFFALLLCAILLLTMFPVSALAAKAEPADIWEQIAVLEDQATAVRGATTVETRTAAYSAIVDQIIAAVESSEDFVPGSIIRHGDFFYWEETDGTACGYSPRLRAQIREGADPNADPEAYAAIETVSYAPKGGSPASTSVAAFQPYIGIDGSFTAQYENRCNNLAQALGGTGTTYKTTNATIDNIAQAIETCAVVIFDSHGDTDYASGYDYTSQANTSYICLQSGEGITAEDQVVVTGPYGQYRHAYYGGSYGQMKYYMVDGTAISNHMTGTSPNGLLWMAICLGMATDGMHAPLRAKGVEVAYGYSQSVTFAGDYAWEAKFWSKMTAGAYVKDAIAYMKQQVGCPDPYTSSYPAYPIVVSSEDVYPGHGNVDANQTVYSTWTLFTQFEINAVPNNPAWGSVSVSATKITAIPAYGFYVDDYEVLEGQATVTRDGNVFNVEPQSDCTIQINFAPRDPAVVHFSVPEGVSCADVEAYVGDEIQLPAPEGEPAVEGRSFRFLGWVTAPMAEDSLDVPEFLAAGSTVKLTGTDTTYYALYTYFVAVDGLDEDQFLRVDEEPHSWAGEYVITYNGLYALSADRTYASNKIATSKAVVDLASLGCTYEGNILNGVQNIFTYVIAPAENGTYTVKMKNTNHYLAMASDTDSLTTYTSSNTDKTRWNISYGANGPVLTNAQFTGRSLQYDSSEKLFKAFGGAKSPLTLFVKAEGKNWYTTDPKEKTVCEEHSYGEPVWTWSEDYTAASAKFTCTVCGEELSRETVEVQANGHSAGEAVKENEHPATCTEPGSYQMAVYCTVCGEEISRESFEIQPNGHTAGEAVKENEIPATCTEPGGYDMVVRCTVCGDEISREHVETEAAGHSYGEPEWTWADDYSGAMAKFVCSVCSHEEILNAEIEPEYHADKTVYTASVELDGETYTDVKEGPAVEREIFELTTELKDGDKVVIYNPSVGKALSNEAVSTYYRAAKEVAPEDGKLYGPADDLVWNVTAVEGGFELTDAEGRKLSIQNGKNNLPLDAENTVWEIQLGENNTVFVVSATAIGSSGDHKAVEYYTRFTEFSAYYLNTADAQFIMELYVKPAESEEHDCPCAMFEDMPEYGTVEHDAIDWAYTHNVTGGMEPNLFGTNETVTRAQAMMFLWASLGRPEPTITDNPFVDVKEGTWQYKPIMWAVENSITAGVDPTHFGVNETCNRGQILTFLRATAGFPNATIENPYSDITPGKYPAPAALWAYELDLEKGEDGKFNQNTPCTRCSTVTYIYKYMVAAGLIN